jgi:hypothetical protein
MSNITKTTTPSMMLSRRNMLSIAPVLAGAATLAGGAFTALPALAQDGVLSTPDYDAIIRAKVEGQVIRVGFTPPILSEFFNIMEHAAFQQARNYMERFGIQWTRLALRQFQLCRRPIQHHPKLDQRRPGCNHGLHCRELSGHRTAVY